ncbi:MULTISPECIES: chaplin [Streptomyces]|uniref:Chaplin n=1 Tax=Streptomyces lichenis TaxID=2306967 RepID=A0ABT0I9C3_9ACTN|nr:chaplin [Streptomyces lichenis]MCK8677925.1 chaplin [Streptomyces lichenis]
MLRIAKAAVVLAGTGAVVLGGAGLAAADADADAAAVGSPGVLSGNILQIPVHVPINLCGNTIDVIGILNPAFGNQCANVDGKKKDHDKKDDSKNHGHKNDGGYGG